MTAKQYLMQLRILDNFIDYRLQEMERLRGMAEGIRSQELTDMHVQTSPENRKEDALVKLIDLQTRVDEDIDRLVDLKLEIEERLSKLPLDYRALLTYRYIEYMAWWKIAEKMHYSEREIYYMHGRALQELQTILDG